MPSGYVLGWGEGGSVNVCDVRRSRAGAVSHSAQLGVTATETKARVSGALRKWTGNGP